MKKLLIIIGMAAATVFAACHASVSTPRSGADVEVGSTKSIHQNEVRN